MTTPKFGAPVFRAYTLELDTEDTETSLLRRPRLERLLQLMPWSGKSILISGPAGSGRSTLALQWALQEAGRIQYVSARGVPEGIKVHVTEPWTGGQLVADAMNAMLQPTTTNQTGGIGAIFDSLVKLTITAQTMLVIDDAELLSPSAIETTSTHTLNQMSQLIHATIVLITRSMPDSFADFLGNRSPVRILTANLLAITESELEEMIAAKSFGDVPEDIVRDAYACMGGWFAGIKWVVNNPHRSTNSFDDYVLNELLLNHSRPIQHLILALSAFPKFSMQLVESLMDRIDEDPARLSSVFNQLPLIHEDSNPGEPTTFRFPQGLKESFARLLHIVSSHTAVRDIQKRGIQWYVQRGNYDLARELAIASGGSAHYLSCIRHVCIGLAEQERWPQLRALLEGISNDSIFADSDFTFWKMMGYAYDGTWSEVARIQTTLIDSWRTSEDPVRIGRAHLMDAWGAWAQSNAKRTLTWASASFEALPDRMRQDRMFAAITAENASRNLGDTVNIERWSSIVNNYRTVMSFGNEWWHINSGYHRLNHLAIMGRLRRAYDLASLSLSQFDRNRPRAGFRYALLKAYIDIERRELDLAREQLELAERLSDGVTTNQQFELALSVFHLAAGNADLARKALKLDSMADRLRTDHFYHRAHLLAKIELFQGNTDLAYEIIMNWCSGEQRWPKYFGEPHHHLLMAAIIAAQGDHYRAIDITRLVIAEAKTRQHQSYMVSAYAIQAICFDALGQDDQCDRAIARALRFTDDEEFMFSLAPLGTDVRRLIHAPLLSLNLDHDDDIPTSRLTKREKELIRLASEGLSNREISDRLFISQSTVKNHMANIYSKLGARSRTDAVEAARRIGALEK